MKLYSGPLSLFTGKVRIATQIDLQCGERIHHFVQFFFDVRFHRSPPKRHLKLAMTTMIIRLTEIGIG